MLSSLGYMESIDGVQQLYVMIKFVPSALSDVSVVKQILTMDMEESNTYLYDDPWIRVEILASLVATE